MSVSHLLPEIAPERAAEVLRSAFELGVFPPYRLYVRDGSQAFTEHIRAEDVDEAIVQLVYRALPVLHAEEVELS